MLVDGVEASTFVLSAKNLFDKEFLGLVEIIDNSSLKSGCIYIDTLILDKESKLYGQMSTELKEIRELTEELVYQHDCLRTREVELDNFNQIVSNNGVKFNSRKNSIIRKMSLNIRKSSHFASPGKGLKAEKQNMPKVKKSFVFEPLEESVPKVGSVQKSILLLFGLSLVESVGRNCFLSVQ